VIFDFYFFSWYFGFILGLCRFSLKARWGCQVFLDLYFSRDLVPGTCVLFRIRMCSTWHLLIFTVFIPTWLYSNPSIYPLPVEYLPVYSTIYWELSWVLFELWSAESWIRRSNHWALGLWENVVRVAINRHLICGQNCNSVKSSYYFLLAIHLHVRF
jgi:hypothetical protein